VKVHLGGGTILEATRVAQDILAAWTTASTDQHRGIVWSVFDIIRIRELSASGRTQRLRRCSHSHVDKAVPTGVQAGTSNSRRGRSRGHRGPGRYRGRCGATGAV